MSFHLAAYYRNVPVGTTPVELLPVADSVLSINPATNRFWSSDTMRVFSAYSGGTSLSRARIYSPYIVSKDIRPVSSTLLPGSIPPLASWLAYPLSVPPQIDLIADAVHSNGAAQDIIGLIWLTTDGLEAAPQGESFIVRGSVAGATPLVRQWSELTTITWDPSLPPGRYAIIGSECVSTNGIAHRWILQSGGSRPGGISQATLSGIPPSIQDAGQLGHWGVFVSPVMPRLEVLCNVADAVHTVFLHVVRLRG